MKISGYMVYPKEKGGVSLFQGGLSFQHKRNQSEETNIYTVYSMHAMYAVLKPQGTHHSLYPGLPLAGLGNTKVKALIVDEAHKKGKPILGQA